jgi:hypothetical protein
VPGGFRQALIACPEVRGHAISMSDAIELGRSIFGDVLPPTAA